MIRLLLPYTLLSSSLPLQLLCSPKINIYTPSTIKMQFSLTAAILALTTLAAAAPEHMKGKWSVPSSMTVKEGQAKCGDQAQLSCCNKATYAKDTSDVNSGLLAGALSNLVGSGSGAEGLGLFNQCSELNVGGK